VQIIRAGSGISHAEKVNAKSEIFQIWFDPNLEKTILEPATYNDYSADKFPVEQQNGITVRTLKGENSPLEMDTEGVTIKEFTLTEGHHKLPLSKDSIYSVFVLNGTVLAENNLMNKGDYAIIKELESVDFSASVESKLFVIETPLSPSYRTYAEMYL